MWAKRAEPFNVIDDCCLSRSSIDNGGVVSRGAGGYLLLELDDDDGVGDKCAHHLQHGNREDRGGGGDGGEKRRRESFRHREGYYINNRTDYKPQYGGILSSAWIAKLCKCAHGIKKKRDFKSTPNA